jgi:hypothetical protein
MLVADKNLQKRHLMKYWHNETQKFLVYHSFSQALCRYLQKFPVMAAWHNNRLPLPTPKKGIIILFKIKKNERYG